MMGILRPVSYWRKWEPVDRDLGGGYVGVAVLECGHVERVREVARQALKSTTGHHCLAVFAAADGQLTVTMGGASASQPLPA